MSVNGNYIFKIKNRIILTTENGIFEYNEVKDQFEPSGFFNQIFRGKNVRYLKEDGLGNIWFVFEKSWGWWICLLQTNPSSFTSRSLPISLLAGLNTSTRLIRIIFLSAGKEDFTTLIMNNIKKLNTRYRSRLLLSKALMGVDSLLFGGYIGEVNEITPANRKKNNEVSHSWNSFHFEFASPVYAQQSNIEYSYFLEGFDETWSEFSKKTEKEYTNLPAGNYSFQVKARNNLGNESEVSAFPLYNITGPAWYQCYCVGLCSMYCVSSFSVPFSCISTKKGVPEPAGEDEERNKALTVLTSAAEGIENGEREIIKLRNKNWNEN